MKSVLLTLGGTALIYAGGLQGVNVPVWSFGIGCILSGIILGWTIADYRHAQAARTHEARDGS